MTRKPLVLLGGVMAACVGIGLGVLAMLPPKPGVTKANFDRIEEGMTRVDVDELFGGKVPLERVDQGWLWDADDGSEVWIGFRGDRDRVFAKIWVDSNESIIDKIRRWLHFR
jgi:hypothetical protein